MEMLLSVPVSLTISFTWLRGDFMSVKPDGLNFPTAMGCYHPLSIIVTIELLTAGWLCIREINTLRPIPVEC